MLAGIGIGHLPVLHDDLLYNKAIFDFVEVTPESYIGGDQDLMKSQLNEIKCNFQVTCHGIDLSVCSIEDIDGNHLKNVLSVIEACSPLFFSEHLSYTRSEDYNADIYIPPLYVEDEVDRITSRCRELVSYVGLPFHLENVPDYLFGKSGIGEGAFFRALTEACDVQVIMNLDSIAISAKLQKIDPRDLILQYPKDRVASLTVVPEACMNPIIREICGSVDALLLDLTSFALRHTSARSVLLQTRYESNSVQNLMPVILGLKERVGGGAMRFANDVHATREDLSALHSALIGLLVDQKAFDAFKKDPLAYANNLGSLPQVYKNLVSGIDGDGLGTFRSIVSGTRRVRFYLIFAEFFSKLSGQTEVDELIDEFFHSVTIKNGRDDSDLRAFVEFVKSQRSEVFGELAHLDLVMYEASNSVLLEYMNENTRLNQTNYYLRETLRVHMSSYSVKYLLSATLEELNTVKKCANYTLFYVLKNGGNIKIVPLSSFLGQKFYHRQAIDPANLIESDRRLFD
ncbi:MAG: DUF692 family multinuclear iron-containing protein, partial [Gloeotrichia echinulata HAB0833]